MRGWIIAAYLIALVAASSYDAATLDERARDYEEPLEDTLEPALRVAANVTLERRVNLPAKPVIAHVLMGTIGYCPSTLPCRRSDSRRSAGRLGLVRSDGSPRP